MSHSNTPGGMKMIPTGTLVNNPTSPVGFFISILFYAEMVGARPKVACIYSNLKNIEVKIRMYFLFHYTNLQSF